MTKKNILMCNTTNENHVTNKVGMIYVDFSNAILEITVSTIWFLETRHYVKKRLQFLNMFVQQLS